MDERACFDCRTRVDPFPVSSSSLDLHLFTNLHFTRRGATVREDLVRPVHDGSICLSRPAFCEQRWPDVDYVPRSAPLLLETLTKRILCPRAADLGGAPQTKYQQRKARKEALWRGFSPRLIGGRWREKGGWMNRR